MVTHSSIFALENPMDKGALQAIVLRVTQSWTQLKRLSTHTCMHPSIELGGVGFWCTSVYVWHGSSGRRMQGGGPRNGLKLLLSIIDLQHGSLFLQTPKIVADKGRLLSCLK